MEILIGLVTLLAGVAIPVWLHRAAHPQRGLRYRVHAVRTSPIGAPVSHTHPGTPADIHAVFLTLWSVGRADIPSSAFDARRPLTFNLGASILPGSFASDSDHNIPQGIDLVQAGPATIELYPYLLPRDTQITARMYTQGAPLTTVIIPLIDIQVVPDNHHATNATVIRRTRRRARLSAAQITLGVLIASVIGMAVALGISIVDRTLGTAIGSPALFIAMLSAVVLICIYITRLIRHLIRSAGKKSTRA